MPGSPALVPQLAPGDRSGQRLAAMIRSTVIAPAVAQLPIELVGSRQKRWYTSHTGSLAAWGAPQVCVGEGSYLPELVQRAVLGAESRRIRQARDAVGTPASDAITVVALDGSAGLSLRAPLTELPEGKTADAWCRELLGGQEMCGSQKAGSSVPPSESATSEFLQRAGVVEPSLWIEAQHLASRAARRRLLGADTSTGVGRYVAVWELAE